VDFVDVAYPLPEAHYEHLAMLLLQVVFVDIVSLRRGHFALRFLVVVPFRTVKGLVAQI
jgi:hypothetical protein